MRFITARFSHGVTLAAAIPYLSLMLWLAASQSLAAAEERAFLKFVMLIVGFVGVPLFLLFSLIVFGTATWLFRRLQLRGAWPHVIWGALVFIVSALALRLPGQRLVWVDILRQASMVTVVGGISGAAFWLGALRGVGSQDSAGSGAAGS